MADKYSNTIAQVVGVKGPNYSRMGHRTVRLGEQVLIFGGTGPTGDFVKPILRFNLENFKSEQVLGADCPPLQEPLNDWYLLDITTFSWNKVNPDKILPSNTKYKLIWGNGRGYLVSECSVNKTSNRTDVDIRNTVYEIRITNFGTFKLQITQLQTINTTLPSPRSDFSLFVVQNQLWILGGDRMNCQLLDLCSDVWALDLEMLTWQIKRFTLGVPLGCQLVGYKNKIYFFGGLKSAFQMSSSVQILNLKSQKQVFQSRVCNFCRNVYNLQPCHLFQKNLPKLQIQVKDPTQVVSQISTNFISKLAHTLSNPIQAIGLLIDNSLYMDATLIYINIITPNVSALLYKQPPKYLFIGDNSNPFHAEQILNILFSFRFKVQKNYPDHIDKWEVKTRNQYGLNLKLASLRLGNACLYVTSTKDECIFVAYFSQNQTECPDGELSFNCFYYTLDKKNKCSNLPNRQIIKQNVSHFVDEKQFLDMSVHKTKVYIFGLNDIVKIQNSEKKTDISYPFSQGVPLSSLSEYISILYLKPYFGREFLIDKNKIAPINLISKFKQAQKKSQIQQLNKLNDQKIFTQISLYRITSSVNTFQTSCVYIYHENRLICTISGKQKAICGYILIPDLIQVDFFKSKIENWQDERKLFGYIEFREEPKKRQRKVEQFKIGVQGIQSLLGGPRKIKSSFPNF